MLHPPPHTVLILRLWTLICLDHWKKVYTDIILRTHHLAILTDAKSVMEALQSGMSPQLKDVLSKLSQYNKIELQWISPHSGIAGNGRAKTGQGRHYSQMLTYHHEKNMTKTPQMPHRCSQDD